MLDYLLIIFNHLAKKKLLQQLGWASTCTIIVNLPLAGFPLLSLFSVECRHVNITWHAVTGIHNTNAKNDLILSCPVICPLRTYQLPLDGFSGILYWGGGGYTNLVRTLTRLQAGHTGFKCQYSQEVFLFHNYPDKLQNPLSLQFSGY